MTRRSMQLAAHLTQSEMKLAVKKIERRLSELKALDIGELKLYDSKVASLETKLERLLSNVFGSNTFEYQSYQSITNLYSGNLVIYRNLTDLEYQNGVKSGITNAISILEALRDEFVETIGDSLQDPTQKALKAYQGLDLHPKISQVVGKLFHNGHYANAVEDAVKALNSLVRLNSGVEDKDGVALMQHVFSIKNPILKFNNLADESDKSEQQGYMNLFSGAVSGLRNPRAHKIVNDDPERALEFIAFVSLLAKIADEAQKS